MLVLFKYFEGFYAKISWYEDILGKVSVKQFRLDGSKEKEKPDGGNKACD